MVWCKAPKVYKDLILSPGFEAKKKDRMFLKFISHTGLQWQVLSIKAQNIYFNESLLTMPHNPRAVYNFPFVKWMFRKLNDNKRENHCTASGNDVFTIQNENGIF